MSDSMNVLLVDDELVVLQAFVDILEDEGYTMFTAESGAAAVEILRAHTVDIVVTDINMPGMDGLELLSAIREMDAEIPVIMATAYSSIESTVESMRRGASNYLIKPIKVDLLRSVLAEATVKRRMLRRNRELTDELKSSNGELKKLNQESERVLELIAQDLRQPLIDQMNWCELLMSDTECSLHVKHLEAIGKVNSAADGMLAKVNDLLDREKIGERAQVAADPSSDVPGGGCPDPDSPVVTDPGPGTRETSAAQTGRLDVKILLVEDSPVLRDVLVRVLQRRFHVISAGDGWEALALMAERPHLIVTELNLPSVDAVEMLRHARRILDDFAVLAMYDTKDRALLAQARSLGVHDALPKPFDIGQLVARVEALAEAARPQLDDSVLVVSPHTDERYALYHLLDGRYRTRTVASAEAAAEAAENAFDVAIIDVDTQEYSWESVVRLLRTKNRRIKVLALAGRDEAAAAATSGEGGVAAAMVKPYAVDDLLFRVRDLLGIRQIDGSILRSVFRKVAT